MSPAESSPASIGKSVEIRGEVKGSEDLSIDGLVEGTISLTDSRLIVGPTARVDADVSARDVIILGTLNGNVHASVRVELRKGANLTGDIQAARLLIEEGSLFSGRVDLTQPTSTPLAASVTASSTAQAQSVASASAPAATGGLFSSPAKP
jgi:cytoskeletal protein CcmA (bactofilin family)